MSAPEDPSSTHKRTASATSALQTPSPPPPKRPEHAAPPPTSPFLNNTAPASRSGFPHSVALVLYRDGGNDQVSTATTVLGVYASLADANDEVRRLGREQLPAGAKLGDEESSVATMDINPVRWDTVDGVSCWVELHAVKPQSIVRRGASGPGPVPAAAAAGELPKKLYDADEGEDPDLDDDQDDGGHYD